jgi:polyribonucleotide nucleotidyltransferase
MQIAFPPEVELGAEYDGKVVNITKFGAFVNILPGRDGLLHISRLDGSKRVEDVEDYLKDGQELRVRVREIDRGKVSLELVEALEGATLPDPEAPGQGGGERRSRDGDRDRGRGDRDRGRGGRDGRDRDRDRQPRQEQAPAQVSQESSAGRKVAQPFDEVFEDMRNS